MKFVKVKSSQQKVVVMQSPTRCLPSKSCYVLEAPSDIWDLGCIVFAMLIGKPVRDFNPETTTEELLRKIAHELMKIPPDVSKDARDV